MKICIDELVWLGNIISTLDQWYGKDTAPYYDVIVPNLGQIGPKIA